LLPNEAKGIRQLGGDLELLRTVRIRQQWGSRLRVEAEQIRPERRLQTPQLKVVAAFEKIFAMEKTLTPSCLFFVTPRQQPWVFPLLGKRKRRRKGQGEWQKMVGPHLKIEERLQ